MQDLNLTIHYSNDNCRANKEMNGESASHAIGSDEIDLSGYDTVQIGYPIRWETVPWENQYFP